MPSGNLLRLINLTGRAQYCGSPAPSGWRRWHPTGSAPRRLSPPDCPLDSGIIIAVEAQEIQRPLQRRQRRVERCVFRIATAENGTVFQLQRHAGRRVAVGRMAAVGGLNSCLVRASPLTGKPWSCSSISRVLISRSFGPKASGR